MLRRPRANRVVKLNSERRRAKRSPSFVLGGAIVQRHCAVSHPSLRSSRDASPNARRWQDARELRPPTSDGGDISPWYVPGRPFVALFSRDAFSGGHPWREIAPMRSRTPCCGKFLAPCIPEGASDGKRAPRIMHGARILPSRRRRRTVRAPQLQCLRHPSAPNRPSVEPQPGAASARSPDLRSAVQEVAPPSTPGWSASLAAPTVSPPAFADTSRQLVGPRRTPPPLPTVAPTSSLSTSGGQPGHCRKWHLRRRHPRHHRFAGSPRCLP